MNRSELLQLLLKNDIPVEMRMMLCKLADLGVEIGEGSGEGTESISFESISAISVTFQQTRNQLREAIKRELNRLMRDVLGEYFVTPSTEEE